MSSSIYRPRKSQPLAAHRRAIQPAPSSWLSRYRTRCLTIIGAIIIAGGLLRLATNDDVVAVSIHDVYPPTAGHGFYAHDIKKENRDREVRLISSNGPWQPPKLTATPRTARQLHPRADFALHRQR